jgi:hypothetical protein
MATKLRRETHGPVIDPTAVPDLPGWTQDDYRAFWAEVIRQFAKCVVFVDGWEYSSGCSYEFLVAQRLTIPCVDVERKPLDLEEGLARIQRAVSDYEANQIAPGILDRISADLDALLAERRGERVHH